GLERDVRDAAARVMADGIPRLLHFDLTADDEAIWGWGLGCNGIVDVFVEPPESAIVTAAALRRAMEERHEVASVLIVESSNGRSAPGSRMTVHMDGAVEGSLGDGSVDEAAREAALGSLRERRSGLVRVGDGIRAFIEVITPVPRLVVCGAGHDAVPLVRFAD